MGHGGDSQPCDNSGDAAAAASGSEGPGGAPRYCRLGLPPLEAAPGKQQQQQQDAKVDAGGSREGDGGSDAAAAAQQQHAAAQHGQQQQRAPQQHRLAVLIPYRDREQHLANLLGALRPFLDRQGRPHDVFVLEQVRVAVHAVLAFGNSCWCWC